jgi:hypothetical protein
MIRLHHSPSFRMLTLCTPMKQSSEAVPPIRKQTEDTLRRARRLPVGPYRNDLRQLAEGLRGLEKHDPDERAQELRLPARLADPRVTPTSATRTRSPPASDVLP